MSCHMKISMVFMISVSASLSLITAISMVVMSRRTKTRRGLALVVGNVVTLINSILHSIMYLDERKRSIPFLVGLLCLTCISINLHFYATCCRYSALFPENIAIYIEMGTNFLMTAVFMFLVAVSIVDIRNAPNLNLIEFRFLKMLAVIPLFHFVFGIIFMYHLKKYILAEAVEWRPMVFQAVITCAIILLWAVWLLTNLTGISSGASNTLLTALGFALEENVMLVSYKIQDTVNAKKWSRLFASYGEPLKGFKCPK
jgi:hypothetical protein